MNTASTGLSAQDELDQILGEMCQKARSMGITRGVAAVLIMDETISTFYTGHQINGDMTSMSSDGLRKLNFLAIVDDKIDQMARTGSDSGTNPKDVLIGEVEYRGGRTFKRGNRRFFAAYSGGTQDEDFEIASVGTDGLEKVA